MKGQTSTSALKRFMNKDNTVGHVFAFPFIFGFVCFSLIPVCISFYYAFTNYSLGSKTAAFIGFKNFLRLFQDEVFLKSLAITLKYVLISVPLKLTFALLVAYLLTRPSRMVTFYRSLYYLPSLVGGSVAVALVWKQLFARKGLFNSVLANMGMVVEGVSTTKAAYALAKERHIEMPILEQMYHVLFEDGDVNACTKTLMTRSKKGEHDDFEKKDSIGMK